MSADEVGAAVAEFTVAKLRLEPDDVLLVRCPADYTPAKCRDVYSAVASTLAELGVENGVMVVTNEHDFTVIRPGDAKDG